MFELHAPEMEAQAAVDGARMLVMGGQGHAVMARVVGGMALPDRMGVDSPDLALALADVAPALRRLAERLCGKSVDAHDLLQDTFERALRQGIPPGARSLLAWLSTIMHNLFIDRHRAAARQPPHEALAAEHGMTELEPDASEPAWSQISFDDIRDALEAIEPVYRDVYVLHTFEHLSFGQIAKKLSIQPIVVSTRLSRARKKLRAVLVKRFGLEGRL
jgi:RNA polymerase sigma-70 factor (ECF subfamily)